MMSYEFTNEYNGITKEELMARKSKKITCENDCNKEMTEDDELYIRYRNATYAKYKDLDNEREKSDTITLKRIYSTHCRVCGDPFDPFEEGVQIVYFVPLDNNIVCHDCAVLSSYPYEPRIYKEGE